MGGESRRREIYLGEIDGIKSDNLLTYLYPVAATWETSCWAVED
jgi:hypothetical protein